MVISLIVAMANNSVIGKNNKIPWHLPADLAWFKKNTINKPIIMGRKTFESIGHPLPHRQSIIISRQPANVKYQHDANIIWVNSLAAALKAANSANEAMIIGGSTIYKQALPLAHRIYLTHIESTIDGDTFFPNYLEYEWQLTFAQYHQADDKNSYAYQFAVLDRI